MMGGVFSLPLCVTDLFVFLLGSLIRFLKRVKACVSAAVNTVMRHE